MREELWRWIRLGALPRNHDSRTRSGAEKPGKNGGLTRRWSERVNLICLELNLV